MVMKIKSQNTTDEYVLPQEVLGDVAGKLGLKFWIH